MSPFLAVILTLMASAQARAHGAIEDSLGPLTWTYDPWVIVPIYSSALVYLFGSARLRARAGKSRRRLYLQGLAFWGGWCVLALSLLSPLHWLGERLFAAHMVEHELLMVVAAPLLVVSRPSAAMLWALPQTWRPVVSSCVLNHAFSEPWRLLRSPLIATTIHTVALWVWHMPQLYNDVLASPMMHRLQHASFFLSALLFWWSLFHGSVRRVGYGIAIACLFFTSLQCAMLGIFLTLARGSWYPQQEEFAYLFGLTPMEDQQLAGLVMWIPPGFVYLGFALYFAALWISRASPEARNGNVHALAHS
jgi:putative membrane protein